MTLVNSILYSLGQQKNAFKDLDEPEEYCFKISASYDSTTPSSILFLPLMETGKMLYFFHCVSHCLGVNVTKYAFYH